jgi:hypothetical protein
MTRRSLLATVAALFVAPKIAPLPSEDFFGYTALTLKMALGTPGLLSQFAEHWPVIVYDPQREFLFGFTDYTSDRNFAAVRLLLADGCLFWQPRYSVLWIDHPTAQARTDAESLFHTAPSSLQNALPSPALPRLTLSPAPPPASRS